MLASIATYFTGRAAKAGVAALMGAIGAPGAIAGTEYITQGASDLSMSLLGYVIVGALGGAANWAAVYFKSNPGYVPPRSDGLY